MRLNISSDLLSSLSEIEYLLIQLTAKKTNRQKMSKVILQVKQVQTKI